MHPTHVDIVPTERVHEIAEILARGYLRLTAKRGEGIAPARARCDRKRSRVTIGDGGGEDR